MLTEEEKAIAKTATLFSPKEWGIGPDSWPAKLVAEFRGAKFHLNPERWIPESGDDRDIAYQAMDDIARWLQFTNADDYLVALPEEKEQIFKRAKD